MGHTQTVDKSRERLSFAHKHECSILIKHDDEFFEVKGNFFGKYPMKTKQHLVWWFTKRRAYTENAATWRARQKMSGFDLFTQRYEYMVTIEGPKHQRHVVQLLVSSRDFNRLMSQNYLRHIPTDIDANSHARARSAILGLSPVALRLAAVAAE